ncbi:uncharacterized protein LOC118239975 [Cricetulus griseus]|uniref:uncharacterized protein LOC118239975 n=1 Tax=Cricetulus griseus TaxID=10029 RepID=UPI0015C36BE8|nr:uncharacterized protein LOC118239975 [Cricetulus griseus]
MRPPAPQSQPAWPRNGDSHAPCSHPLGAHPAQPTKGLACAPSLSAQAAAGRIPASPSFHCASVGESEATEKLRVVLGRTCLPHHTALPVLGLLGIATPLGLITRGCLPHCGNIDLGIPTLSTRPRTQDRLAWNTTILPSAVRILLLSSFFTDEETPRLGEQQVMTKGLYKRKNVDGSIHTQSCEHPNCRLDTRASCFPTCWTCKTKLGSSRRPLAFVTFLRNLATSLHPRPPLITFNKR